MVQCPHASVVQGQQHVRITRYTKLLHDTVNDRVVGDDILPLVVDVQKLAELDVHVHELDGDLLHLSRGQGDELDALEVLVHHVDVLVETTVPGVAHLLTQFLYRVELKLFER